MQKTIPIILFVALAGVCFSQKVTLKKPITPDDVVYLYKEARECFSYEMTVQFSMQTDDLKSNEGVIGEKPASLQQIEELKKKLKGTPADADVYTSISGLYKRLRMPAEAEPNTKKAIELVKGEITANPDSAALYNNLGIIYMGDAQIENSIAQFQKARTILPTDTFSEMMLPMMYLFAFKFDSANAFISRQTAINPDDYYIHCVVPMYHIYKLVADLGNIRTAADVNVEAMIPDSVLEFPVLKKFRDRDKNDFRREALFMIGRQALLSGKIMFRIATDTLFDSLRKFIPTEKEIAMLRETEKFSLNSLTRKDIQNKYVYYKSLGNVYLLLNETKKAIPYLKKAIELKPMSKSTTANNANEDYDNLAGAYFLMKDTVNYEKVVAEKLRVHPSIDPIAVDYVSMGRIQLVKKQYALAKKTYNNALALDDKNIDAWLGVAMISWVGGNNKEAFTYLDKAYSIDKNCWELFFLSGLISLTQNDVANAYPALIQAKQLYGENKWMDEEILSKYFEIK